MQVSLISGSAFSFRWLLSVKNSTNSQSGRSSYLRSPCGGQVHQSAFPGQSCFCLLTLRSSASEFDLFRAVLRDCPLALPFKTLKVQVIRNFGRLVFPCIEDDFPNQYSCYSIFRNLQVLHTLRRPFGDGAWMCEKRFPKR